LQRFFAFIFSLFSAPDSEPRTASQRSEKACRICCGPPPARQEKTEPFRRNNQRSQRAAPAVRPQQTATDRAADMASGRPETPQNGDSSNHNTNVLKKHNNAELQLKTPKDECKIKPCSTGISRPMMIRNGDFSSFAVQPRERFGRKYVYPRNAPLRFREAPGTAQAAETHK